MSKCPAILRPLKREINYGFFRCHRYRRVVRRHLQKFYSGDLPKSSLSRPEMVVMMADGKRHHGGLADRLRSFASFYRFCKQNSRRFAINFEFPFPLEDYLVPAAYDWRLKEGELTFNSSQAKAVYMDNTGDTGHREKRFEKRVVASFLKDPSLQYHVYSSFYWNEEWFAEDFNELFKPSERMGRLLLAELQKLGGERNFISVSTRFIDLLGDFEEPKPGLRLSSGEAGKLIDDCLAGIQELRRRHPECRILVTSDSSTFLEKAKAFDYVYSPEGSISHVDIGGNADHTKTFLDFLLIGKALKAYQLQTGPMYGGNFSLRAAAAGNVPFQRLVF